MGRIGPIGRIGRMGPMGPIRPIAHSPSRDNSRVIAALKLLSFIAIPRLGRAAALYDLLDEHNSLCRTRHYLNLGYWAGGATDLDEAADAMADLMARAAELGPDDEVLDVGCGFADQDLLWSSRFHPKRITAVNLNARQLLLAGRKCSAER